MSLEGRCEGCSDASLRFLEDRLLPPAASGLILQVHDPKMESLLCRGYCHQILQVVEYPRSLVRHLQDSGRKLAAAGSILPSSAITLAGVVKRT